MWTVEFYDELRLVGWSVATLAALRRAFSRRFKAFYGVMEVGVGEGNSDGAMMAEAGGVVAGDASCSGSEGNLIGCGLRV